MDHRIAFVQSIAISRSSAFLPAKDQAKCVKQRKCCKFGASPQMCAGVNFSKLPASVGRAYPTRDQSGLTVIDIAGVSKRPTPLWVWGLIASIILWICRRLIVLRHLARPYRRDDLSGDIAKFYDERTMAWEAVWGDHLHHGLYDVVNGKRLQGHPAQVRTMTELLRFGGLDDVKLPKGAKILDVGCGIGGASRYLARHFRECEVTGITLSPYQAQRATEINMQQGLGDRVKNEVQNALNMEFPDNSFDIVWSLESGEHMKDKQLFLKECSRVLKPGGKMVMLAWCIRESTPPLKVCERFSIRRIMEEYCLPTVSPPSEYNTEMIRSGFRGVAVSDWTKRAAPFWGEVVRSAMSRKGVSVLWKYGWPLLRSTLAVRHVIAAIRQGVFRYVAFAGKKLTPKEMEEEARRAVECCSKSSLPVNVYRQ